MDDDDDDDDDDDEPPPPCECSSTQLLIDFIIFTSAGVTFVIPSSEDIIFLQAN